MPDRRLRSPISSPFEMPLRRSPARYCDRRTGRGERNVLLEGRRLHRPGTEGRQEGRPQLRFGWPCQAIAEFVSGRDLSKRNQGHSDRCLGSRRARAVCRALAARVNRQPQRDALLDGAGKLDESKQRLWEFREFFLRMDDRLRQMNDLPRPRPVAKPNALLSGNSATFRDETRNRHEAARQDDTCDSRAEAVAAPAAATIWFPATCRACSSRRFNGPRCVGLLAKVWDDLCGSAGLVSMFPENVAQRE